MANNYKRSSTSTAAKVAVVLALILAVMITFVGVSFGTGWWQLRDDGPVEEGTQSEETSIPGGAVVTEGTESGISLMSAQIATADYADYGISTLAETAGTITATITPSNATYKTLDWSVAWANANSSWAKGKTVTDYFTVAPTSEGATTATWQCLQDFGEPIIVTATSQSNPDVSGTLQADYVKRVSSVNASMPGVDNFTSKTSYTLTPTPVYTDGTLQGELTVTDATIDLTEGFVEAIRDEMGIYGSRFTLTEEPINFEFDSEALTVEMNLSNPNYEFITATGGGLVADLVPKQFDVAFAACAASYDDTQAVLTFDYIYTYNAETYSSGTFTVNVMFNASTLAISVTDIDLGPDLTI